MAIEAASNAVAKPTIVITLSVIGASVNSALLLAIM